MDWARPRDWHQGLRDIAQHCATLRNVGEVHMHKRAVHCDDCIHTNQTRPPFINNEKCIQSVTCHMF